VQKLEQYITRIREHDAALWSDDEVVQAEISQRLGWMTLPEQAPELYPLLDSLTEMASRRDISNVILIGMGGSSLAAYVFAQTYHDQVSRPLRILDTMCPEDIMALARSLDFERTLFIISSKSGTTLETVVLEELLWDLSGLVIEDESQRATHFIAITDPDTPLAQRALQRGYTLITSPFDVGGRFSAFSVYGLVPSALIGIDVRMLVDEAREAQHQCETAHPDNPAIRLATELWLFYQQNNDKLPLPDIALSPWLEQLIAESLGKQGKGFIPFIRPLTCCCCGSIIPCPDSTRSIDKSALAQFGGLQQCCQKNSKPPAVSSVARAMVVWEWTTALLGVLMGVNPFDQPNVVAAKESILRVLVDPHSDQIEEDIREMLPPYADLLSTIESGDYVSILAYVSDQEFEQLKEDFVPHLASKLNCPLCLEQGPRYLHSVRQLHEGGPNTGVFIAIDNRTVDSPNMILPHVDYTLRELFDAQRVGDVISLRERGRRVTMVNISEILTMQRATKSESI